MNEMNQSDSETEPSKIAPLMAALRSKNAADRERARGQLIVLGHAAVIPLLHSLSDDDEHVRWEAAKALEGIADPAAADALAESLNDESAGVRWIAGEALITIGWEGVRQVLLNLLRKSDSTALCTSAHHGLSHFAKHRYGEIL